MSERIKPKIIEGKGVANEILYEFHSRFAKEDQGIVYYHLKDTSQTTQAYFINEQRYVTLPYKIVESKKIKVTGNELQTLKQDSTYSKTIALRESKIELDSGSNTLYFAIVNKMSKTGRNSGRRKIDGNGYELYQKSSADRLGLNSYTLLNSYQGDPVTNYNNPIYGPKGQFLGYENVQLSYSYGAGIIDVEVSFGALGEPYYKVSPNTRGDEFYINLVQPYIYT